VSLTKRIRETASREVTAKDGVTYLIQAVRDQHMFLAEGFVPDLAAMDGLAQEDEAGFLKRVKANPAIAKAMVEVGVRRRKHVLRAGLIGERDSAGALTTYRMVDKPVHQLADDEVNVDFIPTDLADELFEAINTLSTPPVETADLATFRQTQE